jgi:hypothetical protein
MIVQPSDGDMLVSLQVISNSPGLQSEEQLSVPFVTAPSSLLMTAPLLTAQICPAIHPNTRLQTGRRPRRPRGTCRRRPRCGARHLARGRSPDWRLPLRPSRTRHAATAPEHATAMSRKTAGDRME